VGIARQLQQLPQTERAFARGEVGYQQVAVLARTAEHVGSAAVRKEEATLLEAAQRMDAGQFTVEAKKFEHRVDAAAAPAEANRAYARRYLQVTQPVNGLVRLDGLLDAEAEPRADPGPRRARRPKARVITRAREAVSVPEGGKLPQVGGQRPHLTITASAETLIARSGQPAWELAWADTISAETVRRLSCDAVVSCVSGVGEATHETRTIPAATRRALVDRDRHCAFPGCDRRPDWTDAHHLVHWADGGPTKLTNLARVCRPHHHRMLHEGRWRLERNQDGRMTAVPPAGRAGSRASLARMPPPGRLLTK